MDFITGTFTQLKQMNKRELLTQGINLGLIVSSALMLWKALILVTGSESPVVVVLSGSMEPGFYRGDILFLYMGRRPLQSGEVIVYLPEQQQTPPDQVDLLASRDSASADEVVVFNVDERPIPIVHRIIRVHEKEDSSVDVLTKGDNNKADDRVLYAAGQKWLNKKHIMGRVVGYLPYVGMVTIVMNDHPWVKYLLIGVLGLFVITGKD